MRRGLDRRVAASDHGRPARRASEPAAAHLVGSGLEGVQHHWVDRHGSEPKGNPRMASAILDFWTYDMVAMAERLQRNEPGLQPHLFERPVLKFGATLVQLPWIVGLQNNSSAAINNLRRLGARRGQARDEARRIEAGSPGFSRRADSRRCSTGSRRAAWTTPGEVDLIAVLDGHLFVIEVKSTFMRRSQRDAWLHATTTLRKAGISFAARSKRCRWQSPRILGFARCST
jgi:hypothetical protein